MTNKKTTDNVIKMEDILNKTNLENNSSTQNDKPGKKYINTKYSIG